MGWGVPEQGWRKGPWTPEEDKLLLEYVHHHGDGKWSSVAKTTGLKRSGKSCRLRWVNYLRPGLKRGQITPQEESIIIELHSIWGNKWSTIARYLPGRTDNEIKNYWRTHFKKKEKSGPSNKERRKEYQMLKEKKKQEEEKQQQKDHDHDHDHDQDQDQDQVGASGSGSASNEKNVVMEGQGMGEESNYNMVYNMYGNNYHYNWEDDQSWPQVMGHDVASESSIGEEGLWGGLWNLDDSHFAHFSATTNNNNVPNQNVPFSSSSSGVGGDPINYRTGHI